jgi:hypothetical protein
MSHDTENSLVMVFLCPDEEPNDKKKGKVMFMLEKVEMLDKLERGTRDDAVGCHCSVNDQTSPFTGKNKDKLRKSLSQVLHRVRKFLCES